MSLIYRPYDGTSTRIPPHVLTPPHPFTHSVRNSPSPSPTHYIASLLRTGIFKRHSRTVHRRRIMSRYNRSTGWSFTNTTYVYRLYTVPFTPISDEKYFSPEFRRSDRLFKSTKPPPNHLLIYYNTATRVTYE